MPNTFLRAPEVARRAGLSVRSVKRKSSDPRSNFPSPIKLGDRIAVWVAHEVDSWIDKQISTYRARHATPGAAPATDIGAKGPRPDSPASGTSGREVVP